MHRLTKERTGHDPKLSKNLGAELRFMQVQVLTCNQPKHLLDSYLASNKPLSQAPRQLNIVIHLCQRCLQYRLQQLQSFRRALSSKSLSKIKRRSMTSVSKRKRFKVKLRC